MKRRRTVSVLLAAGLLSFLVAGSATAADPDCTSITYSPFDPDDTRLSVNGDAEVQNDGTLDLTPPVNGQSGSVFTTDDIGLGPDAAFSTRFSFEFTEAGNGGADGMVFTLQTVSNSVGGGGGGIGYEGLEPSVGVEFDSWLNGGDDPDANHVGINVDGDMASVVTATPPGTLDGGEVFFAWVDHDGSTNQLEVRVSLTDSRPDDPLISTTIDLAQVLLETPETEVFVGFTSGTGGANARHTLLTWEFATCLANLGAPPTAADDAWETDEDTPLSVPAPGVLANDLGLGLEVASSLTDGVAGSVVLGSDGALTYAPPDAAQALDDGDSLEETFTYEVINIDGSDQASVTITVLGVNDAPTVDAGEDITDGEKGGAIELAGAASDVDDGDVLTITWTVDGPCTFSDANSLAPTMTCTQAGTYTATLSADDGDVTTLDAVEITVVDALPQTGAAATTLTVTALLLLVAGGAALRAGRHPAVRA